MKIYILAFLLVVVCVVNAQRNTTTTTRATTTRTSTSTSRTTTRTSTSTSRSSTSTSRTTTTKPTTTTASSTSTTSTSTSTPTSTSTSTRTSTSTSTSTPTSTSTSTRTSTSTSTSTPTSTSTSTSTSTPTSTSTSTSTVTTTSSSTSTPTSTASTTESTSESTSASSESTSTETSTAFPTTTPTPSVQQNFSCRNDNATRFRLVGTFALAITYNKTDGTVGTSYIEVPKITNSSGSCAENASESLTFEFFNGWSIEYKFQVVGSPAGLLKADANEQYYISEVAVAFVYDEHLPNSTTPDEKSKAAYQSNDYLQTAATGYYSCKANLTLDINEVKLYTTDFKYRAFNDNGDIDLNTNSPAQQCSADEETSSIVPIAVGAALAGLVVIVLIAYLIGRKRSRKTGYENV